MYSSTIRKRQAFQKLEKLLDVAGCETPWAKIALSMRAVTADVLEALAYRVQRAREEAYEEGEERSRKGLP